VVVAAVSGKGQGLTRAGGRPASRRQVSGNGGLLNGEAHKSRPASDGKVECAALSICAI